MSSRKKRDQNQAANGSNRNLNGQRIRTVAEAKRVGELLVKQEQYEKTHRSVKKKEVSEKIKSLEAQINLLESGKLGGDKGRMDAEWADGKAEAEDKTAQSVRNLFRPSAQEAATKSEEVTQPSDEAQLERTGSESSMEVDEAPSEEGMEASSSSSSAGGVEVVEAATTGAKDRPAESSRLDSFWGDEDDDEDEDDEDGDSGI
jgi:hypothetical protein